MRAYRCSGCHAPFESRTARDDHEDRCSFVDFALPAPTAPRVKSSDDAGVGCGASAISAAQAPGAGVTPAPTPTLPSENSTDAAVARGAGAGTGRLTPHKDGTPVPPTATTTTLDAVDYWEADFARNVNPRDTFCFDDGSGLPDLTTVIVAREVTVTSSYVRIVTESGAWWLALEQPVNIGRRDELAFMKRDEVSA